MDRQSTETTEVAICGYSHAILDLGRLHRSVLSVTAGAVCALLMTMLAGCGGVTYVPAVGQVKLEGKPVADCAVLFVPVAGGPAASGVTDAEGRFQLTTTNRPGAPVGDYTVTITKQQVTDVVDKATGNHSLRINWQTPQKYGRPETSGIRKTVSPQSREFSFDL
jgi:hypothetical protein